jgi:hypothetical protein
MNDVESFLNLELPMLYPMNALLIIIMRFKRDTRESPEYSYFIRTSWHLKMKEEVSMYPLDFTSISMEHFNFILIILILFWWYKITSWMNDVESFLNLELPMLYPMNALLIIIMRFKRFGEWNTSISRIMTSVNLFAIFPQLSLSDLCQITGSGFADSLSKNWKPSNISIIAFQLLLFSG